MKKLYLVRHGESKFNAQGFMQNGTVELSEKGIQQAKKVTERIANIPIEVILASPYERARQTATTIARQLNLPVEYNIKMINGNFSPGTMLPIYLSSYLSFFALTHLILPKHINLIFGSFSPNRPPSISFRHRIS